MADVVREFIAAQQALLTKVSSVPTGNLGYGRDLVCVDDLTSNMAETDWMSLSAISQDVYHRLITRKGSLPDDPNYGIDLVSMLSAPLTDDQLNALPSQIINELQKDDRIDDASCTVSFSYVTKTLTVKLDITPIDPTVAAFSAIVAVTSAAAVLEIL